MKQIQMDGVIGQDVTAETFREQLNGSGDIELLVHSAGGLVDEGLAIYNALRDHRRAGNTVHARVVGLAASMSTYVPMAADSVTVEDNAVWMIHNPRVLAVGDQNDMRDAAETLDRLANVLAAAYATRTKRSMAEMRQWMDDETWLFGQEIVDTGFADNVQDAEQSTDRSTAVGSARESVEAMIQSVRDRGPEQFTQAAAMIKSPAVAAGSRSMRRLTAEEKAMCDGLGIRYDQYLAQEGYDTQAADPRRARLNEFERRMIDGLGIDVADYLARRDTDDRRNAKSFAVKAPNTKKITRS
jgi:ATP-dependent protease ClpP protease subunit